MPFSLSNSKPRLGRQLDPPLDLYGRSVADKPRSGYNYIWLAYSCFFFIDPFFVKKPHFWAAQLSIYALFLALYITYVQICRGHTRLLILAAFFLIGVADIPFNFGASCFFIYVAAMLPFSVESPAIFVAVMAVQAGTLAVENHYTHNNPINYAITAFFAIVVGVSNLFIAQGKRADIKLHDAQEENISLAAVAERERIARDLHDVLGHTLSVIVLKAELAGRLLDRDPNRAASEIADVERTARTALAEVREAIGGYRAKGLSAEVEQARMTLAAAGVTLVSAAAPPSLRAREETVLSLALREAVTNIVRHAHATRCELRFATTPDGFASLQVADNGNATNHTEGNGLRGMRERVEALGGRFRIDQANGTRLTIEVPKPEPPKPEALTYDLPKPELPEAAMLASESA